MMMMRSVVVSIAASWAGPDPPSRGDPGLAEQSSTSNEIIVRRNSDLFKIAHMAKCLKPRTICPPFSRRPKGDVLVEAEG